MKSTQNVQVGVVGTMVDWCLSRQLLNVPIPKGKTENGREFKRLL